MRFDLADIGLPTGTWDTTGRSISSLSNYVASPLSSYGFDYLYWWQGPAKTTLNVFLSMITFYDKDSTNAWCNALCDQNDTKLRKTQALNVTMKRTSHVY